jgi:hypothetical protein
MKFCSIKRELCGNCKLVRKLAACTVTERFIKDMDKCPKGKEEKK